ncbi:hypothetical protein [Chitinophaga filiformis]|uniref:Uncharacterized protein n=1 Tax=Chitinophaga filiformis TaxID=104663 RepID=A0A1G8E9P0_CHIFI|nr:hypothetical protein [Chitinophaga filiformis]SDH66625.1 hypothetical protein SAMN04488121_11747 [Chitinophaga filiformis]
MNHFAFSSTAFATQNLSVMENTDPYSVIYELFDFADLSRIREYHWEYLKSTVTGSFNKELTRQERSMLVFYHEMLGKLVEAAHIINEQYKVLRRLRLGHDDLQSILTNPVKSVNEKIIDLIITIVRPERIYQVGHCKDAPENPRVVRSYMVVLASDKMFCDKWKIFIESVCVGLGSVLVSFIENSELIKILSLGHSFYSQFCVPENCLYGCDARSENTSTPENAVSIHDTPAL